MTMIAGEKIESRARLLGGLAFRLAGRRVHHGAEVLLAVGVPGLETWEPGRLLLPRAGAGEVLRFESRYDEARPVTAADKFAWPGRTRPPASAAPRDWRPGWSV